MPAITAAVLGGVGTAVGLASAGMSFGQASKQRKAQQEAQKAADKAFTEARKALEVNYYKGLSIQKEPYELEREGLAQAGAQAMEAARESERQLAPTAGRVQMAQNQGQAGIRTAMGQDLSGLERLTADEESRLRDARAQISLEEAAGAQYTAGQAAKAQQEAMATGFQGLTNAMSTAAGMTDKLYATSGGVRSANKLENQYNKLAESGQLGAQYLDASGKAIPFQQAYAYSQKNPDMQRDILKMQPDAFKTYLGQQPVSALKQLRSVLSGPVPSDLSGIGGFAVQGLSPAEVAAGMNVKPITNYTGIPMSNMAGVGVNTLHPWESGWLNSAIGLQ